MPHHWTWLEALDNPLCLPSHMTVDYGLKGTPIAQSSTRYSEGKSSQLEADVMNILLRICCKYFTVNLIALLPMIIGSWKIDKLLFTDVHDRFIYFSNMTDSGIQYLN